MLIAALIVGLLSMSGAAYAWWGGGPVWGWDGVPSLNDSVKAPEDVQKALDATAPLRREIHNKWFDYREAVRKGDQKQAEAISAELQKLRAELADKLGMPAGMGMGNSPVGMGMGPMHHRMMGQGGVKSCPKHPGGGPAMLGGAYGMSQGGPSGCPQHERHDGCGMSGQRYDSGCGNCGQPCDSGCDNGCGQRYDSGCGNCGQRYESGCDAPRHGNCGCRQ